MKTQRVFSALLRLDQTLLETDTFRSDELAEPLGELASQVPGSR